MGNIVAIAQKELKSYFASPIGYIITGIWALLYGWFFFNILYFFVRQSMSMSQFQGPQALNLNQQLIRPLIGQNLPILVLFLLPAVTMRTYAEEKRSGTVELLFTSPLTDLEIILGKFFGAMALYAVMLGVTLLHVLILFAYGSPEWKRCTTRLTTTPRRAAPTWYAASIRPRWCSAPRVPRISQRSVSRHWPAKSSKAVPAEILSVPTVLLSRMTRGEIRELSIFHIA